MLFGLSVLLNVVLASPIGPQTSSSGHIVIPPTKSEGPIAALFVFQGAFVPTKSYVDLATQIQSQFPGRIYVGIPQFKFDLSLPPQVPIVSPKDQYDETMTLLKKSGFTSGPIFLAGHSIGGWAVQTFGKTYPTLFNAIILFGATIEQGSEKTFPLDVLTISGEYDKPMRTAESSFLSKVSNIVIVPASLTHMAYSNYEYLPSNTLGDFQAKITAAEGHITIARSVADYLVGRFAADSFTPSLIASHKSSLKKAIDETDAFLAPLIKALDYEGSYSFKKPCNTNTPSPQCPYYAEYPLSSSPRVSSNNNNCRCGSPLASMAQAIVAHVDTEKYSIESVNAYLGVSDKASYYPHIWNSCEGVASKCALNITTAAENIYGTFNIKEIFTYVSASEIRMKMKSRQSILIATSNKDAGKMDTKVTDPSSTCKTINEKIYQTALSMIPKEKVDFYLKHGDQYTFGEDVSPFIGIGPAWLYSPLQYNERNSTTGIHTVEIVSPGFVTDVAPTFGLDALKQWSGHHYCKLISPARVVEWVYTESLRRKISWSAAKFDWSSA